MVEARLENSLEMRLATCLEGHREISCWTLALVLLSQMSFQRQKNACDFVSGSCHGAGKAGE